MIDGSFQDVMTLPADKLPTAAQRIAIENHIAALRRLDAQQPMKDEGARKATFVLISNFMLVLPSQINTEPGAEATADAYMVALDEVPYWAVEAAIARWYKGSCGKDERGDAYNYKWRPDPATLLRIARGEQWRVVAVPVREYEKILKAVAYVDNSAELELGTLAMRGLHVTLTDKNRDDAEKKTLTFDEAVKIGRKHYDNQGGKDGTSKTGA